MLFNIYPAYLDALLPTCLLTLLPYLSLYAYLSLPMHFYTCLLSYSSLLSFLPFCLYFSPFCLSTFLLIFVSFLPFTLFFSPCLSISFLLFYLPTFQTYLPGSVHLFTYLLIYLIMFTFLVSYLPVCFIIYLPSFQPALSPAHLLTCPLARLPVQLVTMMTLISWVNFRSSSLWLRISCRPRMKKLGYYVDD